MRKEFLFLAIAFNAMMTGCSKSPLPSSITNEETLASSTNKVAVASTSALTAGLLWDGAATNGISVFKDVTLQASDGTYYNNTGVPSPNGSYFQAVTDSSEGTVWHSHKDDADKRSEVSHAVGVSPVTTTGATYYIGYRFKLKKVSLYPAADGYHVLMQWKTGGTPNLQNYPVLAVISNGKFVLQHFADGQISQNLFTAPVSSGQWYSLVVKIKVGNTTSTGNVQVWWGNDAAAETLLTGGNSYTCKTFDGTYVGPKWGYYGDTGLVGDTYYSRMKIGTTYDSVKPY